MLIGRFVLYVLQEPEITSIYRTSAASIPKSEAIGLYIRSLARRGFIVLLTMNKKNSKKAQEMLNIDESQGKTMISFNRDLYKPEAIFQAACSFFDRVQVMIDLVDDRIAVSLELFDRRRSVKNIAREFCELVYSYSAYIDRAERTKDIREELLALLKGAKDK